MRGNLADIWRQVRDTLLDTEHDNGADNRNTDARHDAEGHSADKLVFVTQVFLKGVDGEKRQILLLFGISQNVNVNQFAHLQAVGGYILDHVREELGDIPAL